MLDLVVAQGWSQITLDKTRKKLWIDSEEATGGVL